MFISLLAFMPFRVQRKEPAAKRRRKGSPITLVPQKRDSPHFSKIDGRCETRPLAADSNSRSLRLPLTSISSNTCDAQRERMGF